MGVFDRRARLFALSRLAHWAMAGAAVGFGTAVSAAIWAHPSEVAHFDWLVTRQRPDVGGPCCGAGPGTDQYFSDHYESGADGSYRVWIDGFAEPALVSASKVIPEDVNPTGRGVIWMSAHWPAPPALPVPGIVFCFEPGTGT